MAAPQKAAATPDTLITIKITYEEVTKKLRLPLRDLSISVLPYRVSHLTETLTI
jgi:next-to-BRCA1 protein 1